MRHLNGAKRVKPGFSLRLASVALGQRGQSLTEFLIVATFLLIPLFLIIPVIAGLISQKQDVELAARYAAWERTVWHQSAPPGPDAVDTVKSDAQVAHEIDARIFALDRRPVVSTVDDDLELDAFSHRADTGQALILEQEAGAGAALQYARQSATESEPGGLVGAMGQVLGALSMVSRFELNQRGLFEASVAVDIVDLTDLFDLIGVDMSSLSLSRRNVLFAEAWTGGSKARTEYLISGLLPQQALMNGPVSAAQALAATQPFGEELSSNSLKFGHVDIDPLPPYRVGPVVPE